jgi:hypothetical protein
MNLWYNSWYSKIIRYNHKKILTNIIFHNILPVYFVSIHPLSCFHLQSIVNLHHQLYHHEISLINVIHSPKIVFLCLLCYLNEIGLNILPSSLQHLSNLDSRRELSRPLLIHYRVYHNQKVGRFTIIHHMLFFD